MGTSGLSALSVLINCNELLTRNSTVESSLLTTTTRRTPRRLIMADAFSDEHNAFDPDSTENPYSAAPIVDAAHVPNAPSNVEAVRNFHLSHEASVKSIGVLYLLGAIFVVPLGLYFLVLPFLGGAGWQGEAAILVGLGLFYLSLGLVQGFTAVGLRRLRPWARIPAVVLSTIGLIGFPIGTLVSAYFLYLLLSQKGKTVFSDEYQAVIAQTPHIRYKTSIFVWILLGLLLIVLAFAFIGMYFAL